MKMRGKIEVSVWLYLMILLYVRMIFCGKGYILEVDSKYEGNYCMVYGRGCVFDVFELI